MKNRDTRRNLRSTSPINGVTAEFTLTEGTYPFCLLGIWAIHRVLGCCLATTKANEVLARFLHRLLWLRVVLSFRSRIIPGEWL